MSERRTYDMAFFDEVLEQVRQIPIEDIVYDMYEVPEKFCPFHDDRRAGSFSLFKRGNRFHCFSCQAKGDGIEFVKRQENIPFTKAVWKLAIHFDIVTTEQMKNFLDGKAFSEEVKAPPRTYDGIFQDQETSIADDETLHRVFSVFSEGEALFKTKKRLTPDHLHYLQKERGLTKEEIEQAGYFTIPHRSRYFMKRFLEELKIRWNLEPEVLEKVPGFYRVEKTEQYLFFGMKGIGIPIQNECGQIVGIQIRRDQTADGENRYVWFSSSFANEKEGVTGGTGSGSPIHVSYPQNEQYPTIFYITEGVFKSQQLAKFAQATTISVQGVQNWKGKIERVIEYMEEEQMNAVREIRIAFDSDIEENVHIYHAVKEMIQTLSTQFPNLHFQYVWWLPEAGKGIDDVLLSRNEKYLRSMDGKVFIQRYHQMIQEIERNYGEKIQEIEKEVIAYHFRNEIVPHFKIFRKGR